MPACSLSTFWSLELPGIFFQIFFTQVACIQISQTLGYRSVTLLKSQQSRQRQKTERCVSLAKQGADICCSLDAGVWTLLGGYILLQAETEIVVRDSPSICTWSHDWSDGSIFPWLHYHSPPIYTQACFSRQHAYPNETTVLHTCGSTENNEWFECLGTKLVYNQKVFNSSCSKNFCIT